MNIAPFILIAHDPVQGLSAHLQAFRDDLMQASVLSELFRSGGVTAFGDPAAPHLMMAGGSGLVWGTLFDRVTSWRVSKSDELDAWAGTSERFVEQYWGGYLAVRVNGDGVEIWRDPSGAVPCYHARIDGAELFITRPQLLFDAGLLKPEIDWTIVTQALAYRHLRPARTSLRGVSELLPGTAATLERGAIAVRTVWSPWRFATRTGEVRSFADATERVGRVVTSCVGAWGRCFDRPLLEISGGLDSSIVAAVLAQVGTGPHCVTFAGSGGDLDERAYASAVTEQFGFTLEILNADVADVDLTRSHARDLPRPCARGFLQGHDAQLRTVAAREGADAFFSGGGGDNVFGFSQSVLPVIDRWKCGEPGILATMGDVAALADVSLWAVLATSVRRALRWRAARRWAVDSRFLASPAIGDLPFPQGHPWVTAPADILPGKAAHGRAMIVIQDHLEGLERLHDAPILSPLIAQPVVELCMAIPTWLWCEGGTNRAVARRAFADRLPPAIIERRSKGAFDGYCAQVFERNHGVIREMLLEGELARHGLLDVDLIQAKLAPNAASSGDMLRLLDLIDVEAWADAWTWRAIPARVR